MKQYLEILKHCPLFKNISFSEFETLYSCMNATIKKFDKNQVILMTGDRVDLIGIVLSGSVKVITESFNGNTSIDGIFYPSELFAEALACVGVAQSPVTVLAAEECSVLFFPYQKIIRTCSSSCFFHNRLIENMLQIVAKKTLIQKEKLNILSTYSLRERILIFLNNQQQRYGSNQFEISYSREELAEYLCVNRSTMSNELSKMQKEGLIQFHKNNFKILK